MSDIGWKLPSTNGGEEDGLNDSGISYFQANPVKSLTREVIQDSLDARENTDKPAIVEFKRKDLDREAIPGIVDLSNIFETATQFYKESFNDTYHFFQKGYDTLQNKTVSVLAIRDRNTTGLTKVGQTKDSHFHRLTKTSGDTAKSGTANGSFGIGKHAPFAASVLRTMLYGTLNTDKEMNKGFRGVIKIASYDGGEGFPTQGTGYYGHKKGFLPLTDLSGLDPFFQRNEGNYGTDKFILGFEDKEDWEKIVVEESVSNYMWAIINGSLEVVVGETIINKETLGTVVEKITELNPESTCLEFYLTLTSPDAITKTKEFKTENGQIEIMKLFLLKDQNFNKKISLIRGTGMKIYEKGHFRTPASFAGTLIVVGEKLNEVVRKMEPPTHDEWKPGLYKKNQKYAMKLKKDLYRWLNDEVKAITPKYEKDSLELPGLESLLPSLKQEENPAQEIDITSSKEKINSMVIVTNSMNSHDTKARRRKKRSTSPLPTKRHTVPKNKITKAEVNRIRAFCLDEKQGQYRLVLNPTTSGEALIEVKLIGESITERAKIYEAVEDQTGNRIEINENVLGPLNFVKGANKTITITLDQVTRYSLEVVRK